MTPIERLRSDGVRRIEDAVAHWPALFGEAPPDLADRRLRALSVVVEATTAAEVEAAIVAAGLGVL